MMDFDFNRKKKQFKKLYEEKKRQFLAKLNARGRSQYQYNRRNGF